MLCYHCTAISDGAYRPNLGPLNGGPIFSREDRVFDPTDAELFRPSSLSAKRMGSREWDDHLSIMIVVRDDNLPCFRILKANVK